MTIQEVVDSLHLEILGQYDGLDQEITGGYASDL